MQDDPVQSARAPAVDALTEADPGFVSVVSVVELWWLGRSAGCQRTVTFDRRAASAALMHLT